MVNIMALIQISCWGFLGPHILTADLRLHILKQEICQKYEKCSCTPLLSQYILKWNPLNNGGHHP